MVIHRGVGLAMGNWFDDNLDRVMVASFFVVA